MEEPTKTSSDSLTTEQRLAAVLETLDEAFVEVDQAGTVVCVNRLAEELLDRSRGQLLKQPLRSVFPPSVAQRLWSHFQAVRGDQPATEFTTFEWPPYFSVSIRLCALPTGGVIYLQGAVAAEQTSKLSRPILEQDFLEAILDNLQAGVVACDASGQLILFNQAAREFHGIPERPLLPRQWAEHYDLYLPDGETPMAEGDIPLFQALQGQTVDDVEMVIAPQHQPSRTLLVSGRAIFSPDGQKLGAVVVMHDITERKQAEVALRQSEAQLSSIFETIPDGVAILDRDGHIVSANTAAQQILRLAQSNLSDRSYNDPAWSISTVDGQSFPEESLPFAQVMRSGQSVHGVEHAIAHSDGSRTMLSVSASPLFNQAGDIIYVVAALSDITARVQAEAERQRTEHALQQSEQLYRSLVETAAEGIVLQQANGEIYTCNANAERILGLTAEQMMGRSSLDPRWRAIREDGTPFPGDLHPAMVTLRTGEPQTNIIMGVHKPDSTLTWISINTRPLHQPDDHQPNAVVVTFFEITDRKQAEAEHLQRLEVQAAHAIAEAKQVQAVFLADISAALASSLEYEQTLQKAADMAVPYFADWCSIDLLNPDRSISRVAIAHLDPAKVEAAWELTRRFPKYLEQGFGIAKVIQTGQPEIVPEITDAMLFDAIQDPKYRQAVRQYGLSSCIIAPLQVQDRILGCISFVFTESKRHYNEADLTLAGDVARRVATAIENARLFQIAHQARQAAEAAADRTARLQTVTAALSEVLSPQQVADVIIEQCRSAFAADAVLVATVTPDQQALEIIQHQGYEPHAVDFETWQRFSLQAPVPMAEAARTGQPVWLESAEERARRYPHLADYYGQYLFQSWLSFPLVSEGRTVGSVSLSFNAAQQFSEADQAFILALSRQCAQAIVRAQLYEAEHQARTEAERANRVKDEFLAILSHELRSPLNPILGWSRLLQTKQFDEARTNQALATIERNAKLQTQLIDDLLDIARILRGKLHLNNVPTNLTLAIEAALETVKTAAASKSIVLHPVLLPVGQVSGDDARLQQIVWNLLSNAIKFTPEGGRVEIHLQQIDNFAHIIVKDTGKGISPEFLPWLFESFRQEDVSTTRQYGGLGLGLSIVKYLVEAHGGSITAKSPGEGLGATFTVCLPLIQTGRNSDQSLGSSHLDLDLTAIKVLTVDDDPDTLELLVTVLSQYGAEVRGAASVAEALSLFDTFQPQVLVSDIGMPNENGFALIRQIRALAPENGGQIPAIALTAYTRDIDKQEVLASGYQQHLSKPVEIDNLVRAVKQLISS